MTTEIPRPDTTSSPDEPIKIDIPRPEVSIEQVVIPWVGVLRVRLRPAGESGTSGFAASLYRVTVRGGSRMVATLSFGDGSLRSATATPDDLSHLAAAMNGAQAHDFEFQMEEFVTATQPNVVASPQVLTLEGELGLAFGAADGDDIQQGLGTLSWSYRIDLARLQQLQAVQPTASAENVRDPVCGPAH